MDHPTPKDKRKIPEERTKRDPRSFQAELEDSRETPEEKRAKNLLSFQAELDEKEYCTAIAHLKIFLLTADKDPVVQRAFYSHVDFLLGRLETEPDLIQKYAALDYLLKTPYAYEHKQKAYRMLAWTCCNMAVKEKSDHGRRTLLYERALKICDLMLAENIKDIGTLELKAEDWRKTPEERARDLRFFHKELYEKAYCNAIARLKTFLLTADKDPAVQRAFYSNVDLLLEKLETEEPDLIQKYIALDYLLKIPYAYEHKQKAYRMQVWTCYNMAAKQKSNDRRKNLYYELALKICDLMLAENAEDIGTLELKAHVFASLRNYVGIYKVCKAILKIDPSNSRATYNTVCALFNLAPQGSGKAAAHDWTGVIFYADTYLEGSSLEWKTEVLLMKGIALGCLGKLDEALKVIEDKSEDESRILRLEKARGYCDAILGDNPTLPIFAIKARILTALGLIEEARNCEAEAREFEALKASSATSSVSSTRHTAALGERAAAGGGGGGGAAAAAASGGGSSSGSSSVAADAAAVPSCAPKP